MGDLPELIVPVVLILTVGGVAILRPLSKRLGDLLEAMAVERRTPKLDDEIARLRHSMEHIGERLELLEERQDFTDALLRSPDKRRLPAADPEAGRRNEADREAAVQ